MTTDHTAERVDALREVGFMLKFIRDHPDCPARLFWQVGNAGELVEGIADQLEAMGPEGTS